jgi:phosphoribosylaminoimidazole-succinocarboxamide synthase
LTTIMESPLPDLIYRGKVRDTHEMGDGLLLMVATDRISAFDVVMPNGIPDKGAVLCQLSSFWFAQTAGIVPNHLVALAVEREDVSAPPEIARRSMVVRRAERIDVECVIRGYITGSAWAEYKKSGTVQDLPMQAGLQEGDRFPEPLFTPTTKAEVGHDENMSKQEVEDMVGVETAKLLEDTTAKVYMAAHEIALEKGIIIADTKMEFGFIDGELTLIDELLTPDSSRFWDALGYSPGKSQPNFDKQFVRDWLNSQGWDHEPPAPVLPDDVVSKTRERYLEAHTRLTGKSLS